MSNQHLNNPPRRGDHAEPVYDRQIVTIDWNEIRRKRHARLEDEIARGVDNEETRAYLQEKEEGFPQPVFKKKPKKKPRPTRSKTDDGKGNRGANLRDHGPRYDYDHFVRLYEMGLKVPAIARALECHPNTVRDGLRAKGVYDPERDKRGSEQWWKERTNDQ